LFEVLLKSFSFEKVYFLVVSCQFSAMDL